MPLSKKLFLFVTLLLMVVDGFCAEPVPFTPVLKYGKEVLVPGGEPETTSDYVTLPALETKKDMRAVLKLNIRLVTKGFGGWNPWMAIELNGVELNSSTKENTPRLLLRGFSMPTTRAQEPNVSYWKNAGHSLFMTLFAPADTEELDGRIVDRSHPYVYYFDIEDLVSKRIIGADDRIENDAPNRLRFVNALPKRIADYPLLVKDIEIGYVPVSRMAELARMKLMRFDNINMKASLKGNGYTLSISDFGGMELAVDGEKIYVESAFSYAASPEMKFNRLGVDEPKDNAENVITSVKQNGNNDILVTMKANNISLKRSIALADHKVNVVDEIENTTGDDIGLKWANEVSLNGIMPALWRLSGMTLLQATDNSNMAMTNPTAYFAGKQGAAGFVVEDTVSRVLLEMKLVGNKLGFASKGVGVPKGKSIKVEWSIYPLNAPENGYFDLVNKIREDWKVNVTVPGPYLISAQDLPGLKLQFASVTPWFEYADGLPYTREQYKELVTKKMNELRAKFPGIKLMALLETNLVNFDSTTVPWGNELPLTYGDRKNPRTAYAQYLTPELSKKLNAATFLRDSLLHDKDGNVMIDTHYVYQQKPWINLMPQPEMGNARYKQMLEQIDYVINEVGFDGVYIDQFNPTLRDGVSYDRWDGYSITMDRTGKITSRIYNYAITGATARMEIVKKVTSRGGQVLTNGHPVTREEQSTGRLSFAEMENDVCNPMPFLDKKPPEMRYQAMGHLASPIILNLRPGRHTSDQALMARVVTKGIITALRNGVLPYYYGTNIPTSGPYAGGFEIANWMFPFTPVKLGEGVLVGKERTVVCVSGTYKVGGAKEPAVAHFNNHSLQVKDTHAFKVTGKPGDWTVEININDWNEVAAIEIRD